MDFVSNTYSLVFSAGQQSLSLVVNTIDDKDCEQDEFFKLVITGSDMPSKVQIDPDDCYIIIKDNDSYPSGMSPSIVYNPIPYCVICLSVCMCVYMSV